MIRNQSYKYDFDEKISDIEQEVINKFLDSYRKKNIIVADNLSQDFSIIPLEETNVFFKCNENTWKKIKFYRQIFHKGKYYIVELELEHVGYEKNDPKCLTIRKFNIITNDKIHTIKLDTKDNIKKLILFNIISIFDERKIISPLEAYSSQMFTNKALQNFITNHEWANIYTGIKQMPELANSLFIMQEGFDSANQYTADFGTILYQLLSFRINNAKNFSKKDLLELDKLILKLRKANLLKIQLYENIGGSKSWITRSILLESKKHNERIQSSQQYTTSNTKLKDEQNELNKCIKTLKKAK